MIEPPSKELLSRLRANRLCSPRDLKRCRPRVRRLAYDLPAFDSVWIDALVQARKLTPFQAAVLESETPDRLAVGPCILVDQLGFGTTSATYLARHRDGKERFVLKLFEPLPHLNSSAAERLRTLIESLDGFAHPSLVCPHACLEHQGRIVTISRYVPAPPLAELLVRRGRFDASSVLEIARQLVDGLADFEEQGCMHGDICLRKVRLTHNGLAVLVDAGITFAVSPELTIHAGRPPEAYDTTAPELIGTGRHPTPASDIYSLGCLLWQLLAGRAPFPTGDPLAKLAAHQTRDVIDVREWAPDTPAVLAEAIGRFTARNPQSRPQTFREVRERIGVPRRAGRRNLVRFRAAFNADALGISASSHSRTGSRWPTLLILLFVLSGASLTLLDQGARSHVLNLPSQVARWLSAESSGENTGNTSDPDRNPGHVEPAPIPPPDAGGVITLTGSRPFAAAQITHVGPLTIRGENGKFTEIVAGNKPLDLSAYQLTLENLRIVFDQSRGDSKLLLKIEAQEVTIRNCRFEMTAAPDNTDAVRSDHTSGRTAAAIAWNALDSGARSGKRITIENSQFLGAGSAMRLTDAPQTVRSRNCLKIGQGAYLHMVSLPVPGRESNIQLSQVTLRQADSLLRLDLPEVTSSFGRIGIDATDSVFDVVKRDGTLFEFTGGRLPPQSVPSIEMTGGGSLATPELVIAAWRNPADGRLLPLPPGSLQLEGITAGPFEFAGPIGDDPHGSAVKIFHGPRFSENHPGIDPAGFPSK